MQEVIADSENIYIELDEEADSILFAYGSDLGEKEFHDAWNIVNEFGYYWVSDEYFDEEWGRYVATCVREKPNE